MRKRKSNKTIRINHIYKPIRFYVFFLITCLFSYIGNSLADDYWVIEKPIALTIYNIYEHRLNDNEKSQFPTYSSWKVIASDLLLSDQFTPVVKVAYNRKTYFFLKLDDGSLAGESEAGGIEKYSGVNTFNDTVQVVTEKQIFLKRQTDNSPLVKGTILHRIFQNRKKTFVYNLTDHLFGWVEGLSNQQCKPYHKDRNRLELEKRLFSQVDQIFQSYNTRIDQLFDYLNTKNHSDLPHPRWAKTTSANRISYQIEPARYRIAFQNLQPFLIQELGDLLYGSNYEVLGENAEIIITRVQN